MKGTSRSIGLVLALAGLVVLPACQNAKDMQISELQRQVDDLTAANDDLKERLQSALGAADKANQLALSLQQQLDDCRRQLAAARQPVVEERPQGQAPPGWQQVGKVIWTDVGTDILFDSGKAKLKKGAHETLRQLAETIKANFPDRQIWVIGHTDSDPIKKTKHLWIDNLDLSLNRAATVARELYKLGVEPAKVYVAGQGEYRPKVPNDSKANKALNRRVEIIAIDLNG